MPASIKSRILSAVLERLQQLKIDGHCRVLEREVDPLAESKNLPAIRIFDGDETEIPEAADHRGRSYTFPLVIRFQTNKPPYHVQKDIVVPMIQAIIEADETLGGLTRRIAGGEEKPHVNIQATDGGADLWYHITYRRLRGNPWATY